MDEISSVEQNIWTLIITWGAIQCLVIAAILLFSRRGNRIQRLFLAGVILIVAVQSLNFLAEYFKWYHKFPHIIWASAPFWFLIGPLLYFFSRVSTDKEATSSILDALHILPFIAALIYLSPYYGISGEEKVFKLEFFYENYTNGPDYFFYAFILSQMMYGVYVLFRFRLYFKTVGQQYANTHLYQHRWMLIMLGSFIAFWLLTLIYHLLLLTDLAFFFTYDYVTYTFLTVTVQAFGISAIIHPESFFVTPVSHNIKTLSEADLVSQDGEIEKILEYVEDHKPYLNPELRISDLSQHLEIPSHRVSLLINRKVGKNFFEFVNSYRVEEVKKRLPDESYTHLTLDAIARDCGFNSSASFYRVFKQQTGFTPKEYLKELD